jgi:MFS family permease
MPTNSPPRALAPSPSPLSIPAFRRLLVMQASFGVAYSIFLILPKYLATHLGASTGLISWIMASASVANVITAPLIGRIKDAAGARRGMVIGNLAMVAGALVFIFVDRPGPMAFLGRALQGLGWAVVFSSAALMAVALAPKDRITQAIGLHGSSNLLTNAIGPALAEPALALYGPAPVFLTAAAVALFAAYQATRVPDPAPALPASLTPAPVPRGRAGDRYLLFTGVVLGVACGLMFTLHQPLALARGLQHVSGFLIGYTTAAVSMRVGLGRVTDRLGPGRIAVASLLFYGAVVAATPTLGGPVTLVLFGLLFGTAHGLFFPAFLALSISNSPESARSKVIAGVNAAFNIGTAVVAPFGLLAEAYGFAAAFVPVGALAILTALGLGRRTRVLASPRKPR